MPLVVPASIIWGVEVINSTTIYSTNVYALNFSLTVLPTKKALEENMQLVSDNQAATKR